MQVFIFSTFLTKYTFKSWLGIKISHLKKWCYVLLKKSWTWLAKLSIKTGSKGKQLARPKVSTSTYQRLVSSLINKLSRLFNLSKSFFREVCARLLLGRVQWLPGDIFHHTTPRQTKTMSFYSCVAHFLILKDQATSFLLLPVFVLS